MLRIRYSQEASNYFLDNGELTRDLMIAIEELAFFGGIPITGDHTESEPGLHLWIVSDHIVVYRIEGQDLRVRFVMSVE